MTNLQLSVSLALTVASTLFAGESRGADMKPDVLIIVSHCLGYSDLGCYGGEIETPNLDALAADGVRMVNAHQNCTRTPSSTALMTGLYAHRLGVIEGIAKGALKSIGKTKDDHPHANLPALLSTAQYQTIADGDFQGWSPESLGFDQHLKTHSGLAWKQAIVWKDGKPPADRKPSTDDIIYVAEASSENFANAIGELKADQRLFGTWVSHTSMYGMFAKNADVEKYLDVYQAGHQVIAEKRYQRLVELGLIEPDWPWTPPVFGESDAGRDPVTTDVDMVANPTWGVGYGSKGIRQPKDPAERMAIYAAQTTMFDRSVGNIISALKKAGRYDNTLIIFCVLQGADSHGGSKGKAWTKVTAVPFTGMRRSAFSGAITSPMIISWPVGIAAEARGSINRSHTHLPDILPTVLAAAGVEYPARGEMGRKIPAGDGRSMLDVLQGKHIIRDAPVFFELIGNKAVVTDDWKWIGGKLYDLKNDRCETDDVSQEHPEVAARMAAQWKAWADEVGAHPEQYSEKLKSKAARKQQ